MSAAPFGALDLRVNSDLESLSPLAENFLHGIVLPPNVLTVQKRPLYEVPQRNSSGLHPCGTDNAARTFRRRNRARNAKVRADTAPPPRFVRDARALQRVAYIHSRNLG